MPDKIKEVFELISDKGYFSDENEFRSYVSDPKRRAEAFELIKDDGFFTDENEFNSYFGEVKKKDFQGFSQELPKPTMPSGEKFTQGIGLGVKPTSNTVSPSASKPPKSTTPFESTGVKGDKNAFKNVDISKPELEVDGVKYDKALERNRIQNYSQGLQKVQVDITKRIRQRDELIAGVEELQSELEASKDNPEQYNALIPQYNELVNNVKLLTNEISSDFNKIDIFEKGIGVTELKRQINEDTVGNRALEGVNNAARILLEAAPATVQVASYLTQRSRGIDPVTAEKVSVDIAEKGFPNIKRWSRELAEENEDLRSVFDKTTAWDVLNEKDKSLLEKDWAKIGELSAKELVQTLPATLAIMATYVNPIAGATTTIMGTAGMELEEMQGSNMTPDAKIVNALTKGGLEYATEKVFGSIPMLKRAIGMKSKAGQEAYQNIVLETWNKFASKMGFAADVIEEVGSEMINTIGGNYTDFLSGKTTEADLYKGLGETFTTSLTMASTLSGTGRAIKYGNKKINELREATKKLKEISQSQETTPEILQVIQEKVLENNEKIAEEAKKEKAAFDSMDDRTFSEATTLVQETQSLEQQLENNEVPEDVIPLVEEKIKKSYEKIDELSKQAKETNIEAIEEASREVGKTENQIKVEELRVAEQAEKDATDPNDQEKLDEIYNRYDKLITPLLEKEGVKDYDGMFNPNKTGVSGLDDLLEDDGYNYFYKGVSGEVVMMSPDEYLKKVRTDITKTDRDEGIYEEKKKKIIEGINKGDKINMPYLSLKEDGKAHKQEGRNRATIAKERGEKLIPVFIEKDISFEDKVAKGQEYINSAIRDGATTKEEVLTKLKEQGLHRDAIRFIDENFDTKAVEQSLKEQPKVEVESVKEEITPEQIETGRQEVSAVKEGKIETANPIRLFKGLFGKRNPDGTHKSAHPNAKGVFSAVDEKVAERYKGEDGMGTFDIPAGTTMEVIRLAVRNVPMSKFREQETEAINASDAQIVKLITTDAKGAEEQYVIKDPALIEKMQKPEEGAKAEEAVSESKSSEPSKSDKNYQEAQEANSIVSKENPNASVLIQPKGEDLSLTAIYVGKEKRGKGIGSKVLESVKKQANKLGKKVVLDATNELDEETDLERLGNFYEKNGFKKVGENKYEYDPKAKDSSGDIINGTDIEGTKESDITAGTNKGESSENVSVPTKEEVVQVETNKQQEDAVQKQTAGQVPVQPEAEVGEGVEGGKPEAEPKEATEESKAEKVKFPDNISKIAKELNLSPQQIQNTYKKYDGSKKIEDITLEDYNKARAEGNKTKLDNSKKAFEALLKEENSKDKVSPTAQKELAKAKENVDDKALKAASKMMENIKEIREKLLGAKVIETIDCKWG